MNVGAVYAHMTRRERIGVGGMHCSTCSESVAEALADLPGVLEASVNYATDEATVEYNPEAFSIERAYAAIAEGDDRPGERRQPPWQSRGQFSRGLCSDPGRRQGHPVLSQPFSPFR